MADVREQSTTTNSSTTTLSDTPRVEVYDTGKPTPPPVMVDEERTQGTTPYAPATPLNTTPEVSGVNWGLIGLAVLVVLAVIILYMWFF
jgi:hypothetical protein